MLGKTKFTAFAMALSLIFLGVQGDYSTNASAANENFTYTWPVPSSTVVTKEYSDSHKGIDITSEKKDAEVVAARGGVVIAACSKDCKHTNNYPEYCCNYGKGNYVTIHHDDGTYASYWHLKYGSVKVVEGQNVEAGEVIGIMGASGRTSDTHLHFQLYYSAEQTINTNQDSLSYSYDLPTEEVVEKKVDNVWSITADGGVNFRSGAGTDYKVIDLIKKGTEVTVIDTTEINGKTWGKAIVMDNEGWFSLEYAQKVKTKEKIIEKERCTVLLNPNGGEIKCTGYEYAKGEEFSTLPKPKKDGFTFTGWFTEKEGGNEINPKYTVNDDITLYAHWTYNS